MLGFFALYLMKFDLVLRKLWTILMVQEIREPHNADQVICHLDNANNLIVLLLQGVRDRQTHMERRSTAKGAETNRKCVTIPKGEGTPKKA